MVGPEAGALAIVALLTASITLSILVILGILVPRWMYRQTATERDQYRDDAYTCSRTVALSQAQQQQLLDYVTELQRTHGVDHQENGGWPA
jgi:inner membrane protein involved in colicin E2 resistance